jgi:ABC transporter substrate binding protein
MVGVTPMAFAVLRLTTNSNFVGCSTGNSEGVFSSASICATPPVPPPTIQDRESPAQLCLQEPQPRPQQLADFAIKAHLPTMHAFRFFVDAGGLMSYGATQSEIYTNAAEQVAKILDGARPSELPLRQAMRFEFVINLKTANQLGLTIPQSVLFRADKVIK